MRVKLTSVADPNDLSFSSQITQLAERIEDEFRERLFLSVPPGKADYFKDNPPADWSKVQDKFPGVTADIVDAGWCLGIDRSTAAVYHLMRVMEYGVRRLAKRLRLPPNLEHRPWGDILREARTAIGNMPYVTTKQRNKRDRYSEAALHLNSVKDAWRNPTMHSKRRYTEEEAEAIYANVRSFMNHLADKVF